MCDVCDVCGSIHFFHCIPLSSSSLEMRGKVEDLVLFLADTATTLKSFVSIFPLGAKCFWEAGALSKLATFYDDVFPSVQHLWKTIASRFVHSRKETIWVVGYSGGRWGGEGLDWLFRWEVGEGLVIQVRGGGGGTGYLVGNWVSCSDWGWGT